MARGVSISGLNLFPVRVVPIGPVLFRRDASERGRGFARASQCHAKTYPHMNHIVISHNGFQYCVQDVEPDADVLFQCLKKRSDSDAESETVAPHVPSPGRKAWGQSCRL